MDFGIVAGDTDQTIYVRLRDSTTGLAKTGLAYNSAGAVCSYVLPGAARAAITLATQTANGAHSDGGFVEVDATNCKGLYRLDLPDAAIASGKYSLISIEFDGIIEETVIVPLSLRKADVRQNAGSNITSSSGRQEVNTTHIAGSAVSTNSAQIGVNVVNAAGTAWASGAITSGVFAAGAITAGAIAADAIGASELATDAVQEIRNAITGGAYALDTDANGRIRIVDGTGTGEINTNAGAIALVDLVTDITTKTGFRLSATGVDDIWDEAQSGHATAGTFGLYLDSAVSGVSTGGVSAADIADAVWDEARSGHTTAGTYGELVPSAGLTSYGTSQGGGATQTIILAAGASSTNDYYNHQLIRIVSGTGAGQTRMIQDYVGATREATISPDWVTEPDNTSVYATMAFGEVHVKEVHAGAITDTSFANASITALALATDAAQEIADAILDRSASSHTTNGTLGAIINDLEDGGRTDLLIDAILDDTGTSGVVLAAAGLQTDAVQEIRNAITGGAYALSTDASGMVRIVDGTGTGELDTASGLVKISGTIQTLDSLNTSLVADNDVTQALVAASAIRTALGLASANLDTQLDALPTAAENAAALLDLSNGIETGVTPRQLLRGVGAALFGLIADAGTGTENFKGAGQSSGGTTRLTYTVDSSGNRSAVTLNL